ncbi:MAG: site-specific DNA-methyltransferase, partial [Candidatus Cloacimonadota bacterium]|nr:site-specific DNA-methyltransferase [Candidatus Cloacimonadota bacterium]
MDSPIKYEEVMGKVKIFKEVSQKIIAFLTQLEELQKKLWEKKKFIIETNYCITLDKIDEDYYSEIFACKEQLEEWKTLFGDEALASLEGGAKAPLPDELKYLVLDTKFFDVKFKYKLLSEFDNLDEDIDGVLISSENFGALNLLQDRYKEQVKTVYIDPPYNTGSDGFLYADTFQHSSWMSFMYDRLALGRDLMSNDGIIIVHIDEYENINLEKLLDITFEPNNNLGTVVWDKRNPKGKVVGISQQHELISFYSKNILTFKKNIDFRRLKENAGKMLKKAIQLVSKEGMVNENVRSNYTKWLKEQSFSGGEKAYNYIDDNGKIYQSVSMAAPDKPETRSHRALIHPNTDKECPVPSKGWRFPDKTMDEMIKNGEILFGKDENTQPRRKYLLEENLYESVSSLLYYGGSDEKILSDLGVYFDTPKVVNVSKKILEPTVNDSDIVLDYFAGSGTTGHAVINLNREDKGKRKYILVEMGEYFNTVTKQRIQKVIYSDSWKDGKPTTKNGISQTVKYFKLESYEDTLNNLEFKRTQSQEDTLGLYPEAKDDYILNYSLDVESQGSLLNIDTFSTPFDYKLKIATSSVGETKDTTIDLVETFNYLLGLVVKRIEMLKGFLVIEGQNLKKEKILIIWRDGQSSDELNEFFKKMDWSVYDREFDTIYVNGDNNLDNL